eukprot:767262-Hanusia_phi.AAC.2
MGGERKRAVFTVSRSSYPSSAVVWRGGMTGDGSMARARRRVCERGSLAEPRVSRGAWAMEVGDN